MPHSYYIPSIKKSHTIESIASHFHSNGLGIVKRVDFAPLTNNTNHPKLQSAFIHCDNDPAWEQHELSLVSKIQNGHSHRLHFFGSNEYWIILKARAVIPQTTMNTSQIVDKCSFLENKVLELEAKLTNTNQVLYQLVCGLYCPLKQDDIRQKMFDLLPQDLKPLIFETSNAEYMWQNLPTTAQGTSCERRIDLLQLQINANQTKNQKNTKPPLIEDDGDTDYSYNMNVDMVTWD